MRPGEQENRRIVGLYDVTECVMVLAVCWLDPTAGRNEELEAVQRFVYEIWISGKKETRGKKKLGIKANLGSRRSSFSFYVNCPLLHANSI